MSGPERAVPEGAGPVELTGPGTAAGRGGPPRAAGLGRRPRVVRRCRARRRQLPGSAARRRLGRLDDDRRPGCAVRRCPDLRSANGLDWSEAGEIPLETSDVFDQGCHEFPTVLYGLVSMTVAGTILTFGCGEGAVLAAGGSYATADGAEWTRLPFGDQAFAAGAAIIGDRVVVATDARTSMAPVIGVTFWASEP